MKKIVYMRERGDGLCMFFHRITDRWMEPPSSSFLILLLLRLALFLFGTIEFCACAALAFCWPAAVIVITVAPSRT